MKQPSDDPMARMVRVVAVGVPHHVTQRGNNRLSPKIDAARQDVFLQDEGRRLCLETLRKQCELHGLAVLGYCLMTNHVHLVAIPAASPLAGRAGWAREIGNCSPRLSPSD